MCRQREYEEVMRCLKSVAVMISICKRSARERERGVEAALLEIT